MLCAICKNCGLITPSFEGPTKKKQKTTESEKPKPELKASSATLPEAPRIVYHAGDLGFADDTKWDRMTLGRDNGHFGTGVYFTSNINALTSRKDRDFWKTDLSKFENLYRVKSYDDARSLYDTLKNINNLARKLEKNMGWGDAIQDQEYKEDAEDILENLQNIFEREGKSNRDIDVALTRAFDEIKNNNDEGFQRFAAQLHNGYIRTVGTWVIHYLEYGGIDVCNVSAYDDQQYGSVIYTNTLKDDERVQKIQNPFVDTEKKAEERDLGTKEPAKTTRHSKAKPKKRK